MKNKRKRGKVTPDSVNSGNDQAKKRAQTDPTMAQQFSSPTNCGQALNGQMQYQASANTPYIAPTTLQFTPQHVANGNMNANMNQNMNQNMTLIGNTMSAGLSTNQPNYMYNQTQPGMQHCTPPAQQTMVNCDTLTLILQRLESMENKLGQLDTIKTSINGLSGRIHDLDLKVTSVETKMVEIEESRTMDAKEVDDIRRKQVEIDKILSKLEKLESERKKSDDNVTLAEYREMKNNLMFFKIPEEPGGDEDQDKICDTILDMVQKQMLVENAKTNIKIEKAERLGRFVPGKTRAISVKFESFEDREKIRKSCPNLKGKPFGVSQQYPKDVAKTRTALFPKMKEAKQNGKNAYLKYDKLYIDGVEYQPRPEA